jgi:hypothetical protein
MAANSGFGRRAGRLAVIAIMGAATSVASFAQEPLRLDNLQTQVRFVREVERILEEADRAQRAGQCELRKVLLTTFKTTIEGARAGQTPYDAMQDWRSRGQEILNRPCPPKKDAPPPPPPPATLAVPAAAPQPADPAAPPVQPAPGMTPEDTRLALQRFAIVAELEKRFAAAEKARLAGNCVFRDNVLGAIKSMLATLGPVAGESDAAARADWQSRLRDAEARPCPPPAPPAAPPSVGQLPSTGSPLGAVNVLAKDQFARRAGALLDIYYLSMLLPRTGIGVRRDGAPGAAPEADAGRTARQVNGLGLSAGFNAVKLGGGIDLSATVNYAKGDASTSYESPASTAQARVDTGVVYGRLSNGSSGIIAPFGGRGTTKTESEEYGATLSAAYVFAEASGFRIEVGAGYQHSERRHDSDFEASGTSSGFTFDFGQTRTQVVEEDLFHFDSGAAFDIPITRTTDGGLTFSGIFRLGVYNRDTEFEGTEVNTANFGPVGNRDLTLTFADDANRWGGRVKVDAIAEYELRNGVSLKAFGGIEYRSDVGAVINPNSGDQVFFEGQTTRLGSDDFFAARVGVGLYLPF